MPFAVSPDEPTQSSSMMMSQVGGRGLYVQLRDVMIAVVSIQTGVIQVKMKGVC